MDFLLECIGFPPDEDLERLAGTVLERGEARLDRIVAWQQIRDARFDIVSEEIKRMVPTLLNG